MMSMLVGLPRKDNRPKIEAVLENHIVTGLIDTGSEVTAVSWNWFLRHSSRPKLETSNVIVRTANKDPVRIKGVWKSKIKIKNIELCADIIVIDGLSQDLIIGIDVLKKGKFNIDFSSKEWLPEPYDVLATESAKIKSGQTIQIKGRTSPTSSNEIVVLNKWTGQDECYALSKEGKVKMIVTNVGTLDTEIRRGESIARRYKTPDSPSNDSQSGTRGTGDQGKNSSIATVSLSNIPENLRLSYKSLLEKYVDVFSTNELDVGKATIVKQRIVLKDPNKITNVPPYRLAPNLRPIAEEYIDKLLASRIIQPSSSPFSSPLMLVRKPVEFDPKNPLKSYRVVLDYRRINDNTIPDSYPMRNVNEMIDDIASRKVWSVLDLSQGYFNQMLEDGCSRFTAFGLAGKGHFEFLRTPQGMRNSCASFQRLLDYVTRGLKNTSVYIDDIIIASDSYEQHLTDVQQLLDRLRRYNLKLKPSKVQLGASEINFLGYNILRNKGIRPGLLKTEAIAKWKMPSSVKEIKQFLGLCSFFRKCLPKFAQIAAPLTNLTRKDADVEKGLQDKASIQSYQSLKDLLCKRPILRPVDFSKSFIVTVDSSATGVGAIQSQTHQGIEHPCAYASRIFSKGEENYPSYRLEATGVLWACKHFKPYLIGREFTIRTDHKPLLGLNRIDGQVLERIRGEMSEFLPYKVEYIPGQKMPSDGLSRCNSLDSLDVLLGLNWEQVFNLQRQDLECKALTCMVKFNKWVMNPVLRLTLEKHQNCVKIQNGMVGVMMKTFKVWAPTSLRSGILRMAHDSALAGHQGVTKTIDRISKQWYWPTLSADVTNYVKSCVVCNQVNSRVAKYHELGQLTPSKFVNERVHIDLLGPLPLLNGYKYLLVCVDSFSGFMKLIPLESKHASVVAQGFLNQ